MSKETTATALTVEQEQAQAQAEKEAKQAAKEARLTQMVETLQKMFPKNVIEKRRNSVSIKSSTDMFLGTDLMKANAVSTIYGNVGYYISASVINGLQIIIL